MNENDPSRLTNQASVPRLELGGNFMEDRPETESPKVEEIPQPKPEEDSKKKLAEDREKADSEKKDEKGRGKRKKESKKLDKKQQAHPEVSAEVQSKIKEAWDKFAPDWRTWDIDLQRGIEQDIKMGKLPPEPISGGAVGPTALVAHDLLGGGQELNDPASVERLIIDRKERDKFFNSIFELVDASPHEFFQQAFTFENQITLTRFMNIIMKSSRDSRLDPVQMRLLEEDFERYQFERRIREGAHNVNAILYIPSVKAEQLFEHLQSIESLLGDAAHRVLGVVDMANIFERVLREEMRNNGGYLRPEAITGIVKTDKVQAIDPATGAPAVDAAGDPIYDDVVVKVKEGDVERRVKEIFAEYVAKNHGVYRRDENGQAELINKEFQPWETDRVFSTARAVMIMSERLLSIAAEGKLGAGSGHWHSLFLQDILQGYSAIIHGLGKFGFTEEAAAIFMQDPDENVKKAFGLLSLWNPKKYEEAYKEFTNNPKAILECEDDFFALQKQNPFKVGDMLTFQAWRVIENPDEPSAVRDFIMEGRGRMKGRWDTHRAAGDPTADIYEEFIHRTEFTVPRNATRKQKGGILKAREEAWAAAHPGAPSLETYIKYANEYFKWIGTAVRFDTLRTTLDKLSKPSKGDGEALKLWERQIRKAEKKTDDAKTEAEKERNADKAKIKYDEYVKKREELEKLENADRIIQRMVKLQPHRLYDKSPDIEKRINERLFTFLHYPDKEHQTPAQKAVVQKIVDNFYLIENVLFRERERLLDEGKTFDSDNLSLDEFLARADIITDDPALHLDAATQRAQAIEFRNIFVDDYNTNKDKYLVELVYRRDYRHGFVLWSGDVPLNEYRLTALGPSGSFVRRARDNKTTGEAATEVFKFMGKLSEFKSLEQMIPFLRVVYDKVAIYSPDRAKDVIADISVGVAKFVAERPTTNIPIWGFFERQFLKPSFAKIVYGETGLSVGATEVKNFFNILHKHQHMITKEKYNEIIKKKVPGGKPDVVVNVASIMSQLIALAILFHFFTELFKKKN